MIPRTKVNYQLLDLFRALFATEGNDSQRLALKSQLAEMFETPSVILTASGRGGLYLLLKALPHSKVLIPSYTCLAVDDAVRFAGKKLIHVKCQKDDFNLDANEVESLLDDDTILIATHQYGIPCQIEKLAKMCHDTGAFLIEDAAASFGTKVNGRLTGTWGDASFFSFDSTKLINVPLKAGFILLKDTEIAAKVESVKTADVVPMPVSSKLLFLFNGFLLWLLENPVLYRLFHYLHFQIRNRFTADSPVRAEKMNHFYRFDFSEWQAGFVLTQLAQLGDIIGKRRYCYQYYWDGLQGIEGLTLPPVDRKSEWVPIRFTIRIKQDKLAFYRRCANEGVDLGFSFTYAGGELKCPVSKDLTSEILNLPFYFKLSEREMKKTIKVIRKVCE